MAMLDSVVASLTFLLDNEFQIIVIDDPNVCGYAHRLVVDSLQPLDV